jgi:hypothetical protein
MKRPVKGNCFEGGKKRKGRERRKISAKKRASPSQPTLDGKRFGRDI